MTKIATVLLTHGNIDLTRSAVLAVERHVGSQVIVLVDKAGYDKFKDVKIGNALIIEGLYHGFHRSPYRNYALGMKLLKDHFDADWYLYTEYDCLFVSDYFKQDLRVAEEKGAWMCGFDLRRFKFNTPKLAEIIGSTPSTAYYLLGCCQFHHRNFVNKLSEMDFYNKLISATADSEKGKFPGYDKYAYEEELWATLAAHYGGRLMELACWKGGDGQDHQSMKISDPKMLYSGREHDLWRGRFKRYPVRNGPEINSDEIVTEASIVHPLKALKRPAIRFQII